MRATEQLLFSAIVGTDERLCSITLARQSGCPNQTPGRIGAVVTLLRRLDVVEKAPIGRRLPRGSHWGKQDRCAGRVRSGNGFTPLLEPVRPHGADGIAWNPLKKSREVQQRMAYAAVTPIEQRQSPPVAAKIALVEVAMDQRVSKAASRHLIEPTGESAHKTRE